MIVVVERSRLDALSDFIGPPGFNGWATLVNTVSGMCVQPIAVGGWIRTVDERGIADVANLAWIAEGDLTYDAWGLSVTADALPFLRCPLGASRQVLRGETVEVAARLSFFDLSQ